MMTCIHGVSVWTYCDTCESNAAKVMGEDFYHQPKNPSVEQVESPSYYKRGAIEVIDFIEDQKLDFRAANVIKYICRFPYKGKALADLKKAAWYVNRLIEEQEIEANKIDYEKTLSQ